LAPEILSIPMTLPPETTMTRSFFEEHAREKLGVGADWFLAQIDCGKDFDPSNPDDPNARIKLVGYVAPKLADGKIAWKYKDQKSKRTLTITRAEHQAWVAAWEISTGQCSLCHPDHPGQEWRGWKRGEGHLFRLCPRCNGTNKAPIPAQAVASEPHKRVWTGPGELERTGYLDPGTTPYPETQQA
jgi:hypothetical protein